MARLARVVVPGHPYHITHCGNRREAIFFTDEDREVYLSILAEYAARYGLEIQAYCLMTNHVHLVALPREERSMADAMGRAHMRYARWLNRRMGWSGRLWANRIYSTLLVGAHLWGAVRYVEGNPLRGKMVDGAQEYPWSSCQVHAGLSAEAVKGLLSPDRPFPGWVGATQWSKWVNGGVPESTSAALRRNTSTGRPTGGPEFVERLEAQLDRILLRQKTGRKPKGMPGESHTEDLFGNA